MQPNLAIRTATIGLAIAMSALAVLGDEPRFKLTRQSIDGGGVMRSDGGAFELSGTFGQPDVGALSGGLFELNGGFWFELSPTDCNEDGAVDFLDLWRLMRCVSGPAESVAEECRCLDVDASDTADLRDIAALQRAFNDATAPTSQPGLTTVDGIVRFDDGSPVLGAKVRIFDQPEKTAITNQNGRYIIYNVATTLGLIHVKASMGIGDSLATGSVTGLAPCANGITEAAVITIAEHGTDLDADLLPDVLEPALGYDPTLTDTNGNGIIDGLEDFDGDGLANCHELTLGSDLTLTDTDNDFLDDAEELEYRSDPTLADTDEDGIIDGEEVEFGSDPADDGSLPATVLKRFGHATGRMVSATVENLAPPPPGVSQTQASGAVASVENQGQP